MPRYTVNVLILPAALAGLSLAAVRPAAAQTTSFVSDTTWSVTDAANTPVGGAQYVILNNQYPTRQPPGATNYGSNAPSGWTADLSSLPGAYWIWAPGVTGATAPASLAQFSFSKQFFLNGTPTAGTISVSVDDLATIFVNGTQIGSAGSITDSTVAYQAQSALKTFNIVPFLISGQNTILIQAQNGPDSFAGPGTNYPYSLNTAGVVFGGSLTSAPVPEASTTVSFGLLLTLGIGGLGIAARRKKAAK